MPLLNSRNINEVAALSNSRAAQIQLNLLKRDLGAGKDTFSRSSEPVQSAIASSRRLAGAAIDSSPGRSTLVTRSIDSSRTECGNPGCKGGWTPPWKSRRHPNFEDRWACSQRCMLAMVKASIARELGDVALDTALNGAVQHRHRVPLGLVMLEQGWITHPQLRKALEMQRLKGKGRIGDWLVSECGLRAEWITRGLSVQWNCPVLTTEGFSPETMARAIPRPFIEEYGILPVRIAGRRILYVGFQDHLDASSAFAVEQISGLRTECGVVGEERYRKAREQLLGCRSVDLKRIIVADRDALARSVERVIDQRKPTSSRLVRLHNYYWLRLWKEDDGLGAMRQIPTVDEAADYLFTIGN